ncbi:MAG: DUF1667 domain-containing protein [Oscillospiraceae bacterium]|nr:DUF1667 domain-containing protein [Oscillospiraceae bacterium]
MSTTEMVCITCPRGCTMQVEQQENAIKVIGNFCKRGEQFAVNELTMPMRTICSTVKTSFPESPVLPCRVSCDIPKDKIFDVMNEINRVVVTERISRGDVIIKNVLGLDADVISTSDLLRKGE